MAQNKRKGGRPRMYDPKKPPKMIAVHVPAPVHAAIKSKAAGMGISASELVRRSLVKMPIFGPPKIKARLVRKLIK